MKVRRISRTSWTQVRHHRYQHVSQGWLGRTFLVDPTKFPVWAGLQRSLERLSTSTVTSDLESLDMLTNYLYRVR